MKSILSNCKCPRVNVGSRISGIWGKFGDWGFESADLGFQRVVSGGGGGRLEMSIEGWWSVLVADGSGGGCEIRWWLWD